MGWNGAEGNHISSDGAETMRFRWARAMSFSFL